MKPIEDIVVENQKLIYSIVNEFGNELNKEDLPKILTPEETEIKINEVLDSWTKENN